MADAPLQIDIVTIFPRMLDGILGESILKRAQEAGLVQIRCVNLRDFATGAVQSAGWVARREPGLYDMMDVLGMR